MKKLYFVRHGESKWNVEDKICGQSDSPLTEKGYLQAKDSANIILNSNIKIDLVVSSPLSRARETAKIISEVCEIPLIIDNRLIEQNFGKWEGHSPRNDHQFFLDKQNFVSRFSNGESMLEVAHRIYTVLDEIKKDDKTYLIVAHNGIARIVKSYFDDMSNEEFSKYAVKNCSITEFEFK